MRWDEVVDELRTRHAVVASGAGWIHLLWRFGPAVQRQRVELAGARRRDHITVTCDVLPIVQLSPVAVLKQNAGLLAGALALEGHTCVLRLAFALDELTTAPLRRALVLCAQEATRLRVLRREAAAPTPYVIE